MTSQREMILLEYKNYNEDLKTWTIPILNLPSVKFISLHIDGEQIPSNDYSLKNNLLGHTDKYTINKDTKAYIIVRFNPKTAHAKIWVPIIVAIIGIIGNLIQPLLHDGGKSYNKETYYAVDITGWSYDYSSHTFFTRVQSTPARTIQHIPKRELGNWSVYLAVRHDLKRCDPEQDQYVFFSGPHNLSSLIEKNVETSEEFTKYAINNKIPIQCSLILVKKGIKLKKGFCPNDYPKDQVMVIQTASF
jgi:hypothetical protein